MSSTSPGSVRDKRTAILNATLAVLTQKGFHDATIDEIAETAGVGKGTIYSYFPSKIALVEELIHIAGTFHINAVEAQLHSDLGAKEQLVTLIELEIDFVKRHSALAKFLVDDANMGLSPQFREHVRKGHRRYTGLIADIIAQGQQEGVFNNEIDPQIAGSMIMGLRLEVLRNWVENGENTRLEGIKEQVIRFILRGLRPT